MTINPELFATESYVDGQWLASSTRFDVTNPATGELLAQIADGSVATAEQAVAAAKRALPAWRAKSANERAILLRRWHDLIYRF